MASTAEIARRYFEALSAHDLDAAVACWQPGAIDRFVGDQEVTAPDGIRAYFGAVFAAFPDFRLEIIELTTGRSRTAVRWKATGTFAGPGQFQGFAPNGAQLEIEGCDVITVAGELITHNDAYLDGASIARQLGFLPPADSPTAQRMTALANLRTRLADFFRGAEPERIADGVWVVRGGRPRTMNVYLIADDGGVTMFDAGISDMSGALRSICARFGGLRQIVLGHADCDHRGAAPAQGVPVLCHPDERAAAESDLAFRPYWDLAQLAPYARPVYRRLLAHWDGGRVNIARTLTEGDEIAGFRVVELPGHAPGLIGLFREADRLALVSDCFYTVDPQTGRRNAAHVPHRAFNHDTEQARASIRKLAALEPSIAWAGHAEPVRGPDVAGQLQRAAVSADH
jgi:glyoxylase-like metal-dependent hydrolase (beta-lactamase superfamily II)/predicted ester cyclase